MFLNILLKNHDVLAALLFTFGCHICSTNVLNCEAVQKYKQYSIAQKLKNKTNKNLENDKVSFKNDCFNS